MTQSEKLEQYTRLIKDYSRVLDLSSPKMLEQFQVGIERSLAFANVIRPKARVLDVGSGAGLPAIPMAIFRPDVQITLCEIRNKRAAFLERAISHLKLENARVFQGDVRKLEQTFDTVTALWLGSLEEIVKLVKARLEPNWNIITRKGTELEAEFAKLQKNNPEIELKTQQLEDGAWLVILSQGQA